MDRSAQGQRQESGQRGQGLPDRRRQPAARPQGLRLDPHQDDPAGEGGAQKAHQQPQGQVVAGHVADGDGFLVGQEDGAGGQAVVDGIEEHDVAGGEGAHRAGEIFRGLAAADDPDVRASGSFLARARARATPRRSSLFQFMPMPSTNSLLRPAQAPRAIFPGNPRRRERARPRRSRAVRKGIFWR